MIPGKTRSSSCVMVVMVIGRTVTMNCESGDVCSPSVTVKLKPPDWSPETQPWHHHQVGKPTGCKQRNFLLLFSSSYPCGRRPPPLCLVGTVWSSGHRPPVPPSGLPCRWLVPLQRRAASPLECPRPRWLACLAWCRPPARPQPASHHITSHHNSSHHIASHHIPSHPFTSHWRDGCIKRLHRWFLSLLYV